MHAPGVKRFGVKPARYMNSPPVEFADEPRGQPTRMGYPIGDVRFQIGDLRFQTGDSRFQTGDSRFQTGDSRFQTGDSRFQTGELRFQACILTQASSQCSAARALGRIFRYTLAGGNAPAATRAARLLQGGRDARTTMVYNPPARFCPGVRCPVLYQGAGRAVGGGVQLISNLKFQISNLISRENRVWPEQTVTIPPAVGTVTWCALAVFATGPRVRLNIPRSLSFWPRWSWVAL